MNHKLHISFRKKRTIQCNVTVGINSFTVDTENDGSFLVVNENEIKEQKVIIKFINQETNEIIGKWNQLLIQIYKRDSNEYIIYYSDNDYVKVSFIFDNKRKENNNINLYVIKGINVEYSCYDINLFQIEPYKEFIEDKNNEVQSYYFLVKYSDNHSYKTKTIYSKFQKIININSCISLSIPKNTCIDSILIELYINNKKCSYTSFPIKVIDEIQYKSMISYTNNKYSNGLLLNIVKLEDNTINHIVLTEKEISKPLRDKIKEKGKNNRWNISFKIGESYPLPYNYYDNSTPIDFIISLGILMKECSSKSTINLQYQTLTQSFSEIPLMIIEAHYHNSTIKYYGYININDNQSSDSVVLKAEEYEKEDKYSNGIPIIIMNYSYVLDQTAIKISLFDIEHNESQSDESFDNRNNNNKIELARKPYTIIANIYQLMFNSLCIANTSLYISIGFITKDIQFINSAFIYRKLYYQNIRFDKSKEESYPKVAFIINNNNQWYYSVYSLFVFLNKDTMWIDIDNIGKIKICFELIEDSLSINNTSNTSIIETELNDFHFEFYGIGLRNYNTNKNLVSLSNPHIKMNLNEIKVNYNNKKSLYESEDDKENNKLAIEEDITIPIMKEKNGNKIVLKGEIYDDIIKIGQFDIDIQSIIKRTKQEIEQNLQLIKEKCSVQNNDEENVNLIESNDIKINVDEKVSEGVNNNIVLFPQQTEYKIPGSDEHFKQYFIEDILKIPNVNEYKCIGCSYNTKHYRKYYNSPLEDKNALNLFSPFTKIKINNFINEYYKCLIRISEKELLAQYKAVIKSIEEQFEVDKFNKEFSFLSLFDTLKHNLELPTNVLLKIYIVEFNLIQSIPSYCDLKLKISLDKDKEFYYLEIKDKIEISVDFPKENMLNFELIEINKYNKKERVIGKTNQYNTIDLEDRYYNDKWKNLDYKPIEKITLIDYVNEEVCNLFLWIEMDSTINKTDSKDKLITSSEKSTDDINLSSRKKCDKWMIDPIEFISKKDNKEKYQIRVIAYEALYFDHTNKINKSKNDFYISSYINNSDKQYSDIHYNCNNSNPFFNWRFVFNSSSIINTINLALNDYESNNEELCSNAINLKQLTQIVSNLSLPMKLSRKLYNSLQDKTKDIEFMNEEQLWLNLIGGNVLKGKILISIEIFPIEIANNWRVGLGRQEPNMNPYLPYPYERLKWKCNIFSMLSTLVSPQIKKKVIKLFWCSLIIIYFAFFIPYIIYHLAGEALNPWNYVYLNYIQDN